MLFLSHSGSVGSSPDTVDLIPLEQATGELFPIQFNFDPGPQWNATGQATSDKLPKSQWTAFLRAEQGATKKELLATYLNLIEVKLPVSPDFHAER